MMRISFNQKQEDIWSTRGHRLPSGPRRKSPVMSMGALHANSGGTATPGPSPRGLEQDRLWPSWEPTKGNLSAQALFIQHFVGFSRRGRAFPPKKKKKDNPNMVFYAGFLSLPSDGQESCEVWAAQPPLPRYWHQSGVILCLQTAPAVPRTPLPHTYNDLEIMVQETTLQSLLVSGRSS